MIGFPNINRHWSTTGCLKDLYAIRFVYSSVGGAQVFWTIAETWWVLCWILFHIASGIALERRCFFPVRALAQGSLCPFSECSVPETCRESLGGLIICKNTTLLKSGVFTWRPSDSTFERYKCIVWQKSDSWKLGFFKSGLSFLTLFAWFPRFLGSSE